MRGALGEIPFDDQPLEWDTRGDHREFPAGKCTIIGPNWYGRPTGDGSPSIPWNESDPTGRSRVIWLARNAGQPPHWVGPAGIDAAWQAVHAEQYAAMRQQQHRHWQAHAG